MVLLRSQSELGYQEKNTSVQRGLASEKKPPKAQEASPSPALSYDPPSPITPALYNRPTVSRPLITPALSRPPRPTPTAQLCVLVLCTVVVRLHALLAFD